MEQDVIGQKIDMITVLGFFNYDDHNVPVYFCECDCGTVVKMKETKLKAVSYKNCGCLKLGVCFKGVPIRTLLNVDLTDESSKTGFLGVRLNKVNQRTFYSACLCINKKNYQYNFFDCLSDAVKFRVEKEIEHLDPIREEFWQYVERRKKEVTIQKQDDIAGKKFGKLTVVCKTHRKKKQDIMYQCLCDCGETTYQLASKLENGSVESCGCLERKEVSKAILNGFRPDVKMKNNTTGYRGVAQYQQSGRTKFMAYLSIQKKRYLKKGFKTPEEAYQCRLELEKKYLNPILKNVEEQKNNPI